MVTISLPDKFNPKERVLLCHGAIVSNRWIVTVASGLYSSITGSLTAVNVHAGSYNWRSGFVYQVDGITIHPNFNAVTRVSDIAQLQTTTEIPFNVVTMPVSLDSDFVDIGELVTVIGWGQTHFDRLEPVDALRSLTYETLNGDQCLGMQSAIPNPRFNIPDKDINSVLCTYSTFNVSTCNGDAGAPLLRENRLIGLLSFEMDTCKVPNVYTRISTFYDWIVDVVANSL